MSKIPSIRTVLFLLSLLVMTGNVRAQLPGEKPLTVQAMDAFLDQIPVETAVAVDESDWMRAALASSIVLRKAVQELNDRPHEQYMLIDNLSAGHHNTASVAQQQEDEYKAFQALMRARTAGEQPEGSLAWAKGITNSWTPQTRRFVVSRLLEDREKTNRDIAVKKQQVEHEVGVESADRKEVEASAARLRRTGTELVQYEVNHTNWDATDYLHMGLTSTLFAAIGGALGFTAKMLANGSLRQCSVSGLVTAAVCGGAGILLTTSSTNFDHWWRALTLKRRYQNDTDTTDAKQATLDKQRDRLEKQRNALTSRNSDLARYEALLDLIPDSRRWDPSTPDQSKPRAMAPAAAPAADGIGFEALENTPR